MGKRICAIAVVIGMVLGGGYLYAQGAQQSQKEEIVLTTYYPVPYGDYDRFMVNRMAVGDTNGDGQRSIADLPGENGQAYFAKSAIFRPQSGSPENWAAGTAGELAYAESEDGFYYYNGSEWVAQGGKPGVAVTMYGSDQCPQGWETMYSGVAVSTGLNAVNTGGAGGGGIVCKVGNSPFPHSDIGIQFLWMTNYQRYSADVLPCAVCVK